MGLETEEEGDSLSCSVRQSVQMTGRPCSAGLCLWMLDPENYERNMREIISIYIFFLQKHLCLINKTTHLAVKESLENC